jgi:peroxiredoxin
LIHWLPSVEAKSFFPPYKGITMFRRTASIIFKMGSYVKSKRVGLIIIMSVLLALSGVVNILLARELSSLKLALQSKRELSVGDSVQSIIAHSLDGTPATIEVSDHTLPTVLYVFSPQCIWCTRNSDNIKAIENSLNGKYRFIGLSMSAVSLEEYITSSNLSFPVYKEPDRRSIADFRLGGTPQTLVISPDGKVVKSWHGAYSGDQKKDVENFFGVNLPGIRMDK